MQIKIGTVACGSQHVLAVVWMKSLLFNSTRVLYLWLKMIFWVCFKISLWMLKMILWACVEDEDL
ncbi:hypothetical protein MtrunA17_Chr7g0272411 [Medicago truncatula]|uniref:Transmembrane protein n=1 Tax=Medicago truncatula TaxID=3880 RepID=A0A396H7L3_MEDTR|nr:hypothetical protein MtrunA17_Chr7g0272411 [Medicago truncatula]